MNRDDIAIPPKLRAAIPADLWPALEQQLERAIPGGIPARSPAALATALAHAAMAGYQQGQHDALAEIATTAQAAIILGITERRVRQLADAGGIGWNIGRDWLFSPADIEAMRARPDGRRRTVTE